MMSILSQTKRCLLNQRSSIFANKKRFNLLESLPRNTTEPNFFIRNHLATTTTTTTTTTCESYVKRRVYRSLEETCQIANNTVTKLHSLDNLVAKDLLNDLTYSDDKYKCQPPCSYKNTITRLANSRYGQFLVQNNDRNLNMETINSFYDVQNSTIINCHNFKTNLAYKFHKKYKDSGNNKQRSHNYYQHQQKKHHQNHRHLVSLLAVLGLFKKATPGDIEEERAKLTDEQKIKKMNPTEILIAKGVLSMCDQDYVKANELFHEALYLSQDKENNDEQEILILNLLACNYFEADDFENAEKLFIDIMKRMIANNVEPTDPAILELSLKLASIYSKNKMTQEKAMKGFKFVINSLLLKLEDIVMNVEDLDIEQLSDDKRDKLALLGWSYDWFAKHLLSIDDYNGAAEMLKKALQISSKVLGPNHDQTLILLNDVGTTMAMNNEPEEGKTFLQKAIEGAIESQSKELASFYVNLGLVNLKLRKFNEAKRYCEFSIELATKNQEHHNSNDILKLSRHCLSEIKRLKEIVN